MPERDSRSARLKTCRRSGGLLVRLLFAGLVVGSWSAAADDTFPTELTQFVPDNRNPIFIAAGAGHWDVKIRERGWILRESNQWKMWYTGYDGTRPGKKMLGYATSADGIVWQRDSRNPIYTESWVEDVCVVPHAGTYYMFAEGEGDQAQLLTSPDGIAWHRVGQLDVRRSNGDPISDGPYGTPAVWFENGVWNLFYERRDLGIWLARSTDLKVFTNVQDEPVMVPGPDAFDQDQIAMNQVVRHRDRYYAVIHGSKRSNDPQQPNLWSTGLATSPDLIHWTKFSGNPLRPIAENKSSGLLIPDGDRFRLYTMHNEVHLHFGANATVRGKIAASDAGPEFNPHVNTSALNCDSCSQGQISCCIVPMTAACSLDGRGRSRRRFCPARIRRGSR